MRRLFPCVLSITLLLLPGVVDAQVSWPMYQANAAHTGYIPVSFDPNDFTLDWEVTLSPGGRDVNPVAAADGKVFATLLGSWEVDQDDLFSLEATDGTILWSKDFGDVFSVNPPAYDSGQLYVQVGNHGSDTHLYTFGTASGVQLNDGPHSAQWERYYAPTIVGGTAYINGGYYGGMYAFNFLEVPTQRWFRALYQYDQWTPAVDGIYAYAYVGSKLSAVRCWDGVEEFSIIDPNFEWWGWSMDLAPVLGGLGDVLVIQDRRLISFDLGARNIRYEIADGFGGARFNNASGQVSVAKGVVYAINNGNLEARNQTNGAILWSWSPPGSYRVQGTMIVTDAQIFLLIVDDESFYTLEKGSAIHAIDLTTHLSVWSHEFPPDSSPVGGEIAWSEGRLYFARDDGVLTAFRLVGPYEQSSVIQFVDTSYSAAENVGSVNARLRRTGSGEGTVSVTVSSVNGTAVAGADFTAVSQVVSWSDGDTADKDVQIIITNDSDIEGVEYLTLGLGNVTGPTSLGVLNRAQVTIYDDEIDTLSFSAANLDVTEEGATVSVNVTRGGPAVGVVEVNWSTANGTASAGSDYTSGSGTLSWTDGDTTLRTLVLSILDDQEEEDNETFSVSLSNPVGNAILGSPSVFSVTITDDDGPRVQLESASYEADETGGSVDLLVTRQGRIDEALSVDWATGTGSATAGQDYVADSGTITWDALDGDDKTISITILDDVSTEGGENFEVRISNAVGGATLGSPTTATVSIIDDEAVEAVVNTEATFAQVRPRIAMGSAGTAVVVWDSWRQDGDQWGVYGQRLDVNGDPVGSEFRISGTTSGNQMNAAVAMAADGSFVVVWQADVTVGTGIFGRRFNASGAPLGGEFGINSSASGNQTVPKVAVDGNGRSTVVWQGRDSSGAGVFARVYGAAGAALGAEFAVNTTTASSQGIPDVTGSPDGGFVVAWESYSQDELFSDGVIARRFGSMGVALGGEISVNETTAGNQSRPAAGISGEGRILVAWEDDSGLDGAFGSIRGRWFDSGGSPLGSEFQINAYTAGNQVQPEVAGESDGRAVVVWEGHNGQDGSEIGVFQRTLFDDGTFAGGEIQLNTFTDQSQYQPAVACSSVGRFVGVWTSEGQDGSVEGVYGVSWPLPPLQLIFSDGFESGDTFAW